MHHALLTSNALYRTFTATGSISVFSQGSTRVGRLPARWTRFWAPCPERQAFSQACRPVQARRSVVALSSPRSKLSSTVFAQWPSLSLLAPISTLMALTAGHKWKLSCVYDCRLPNFLMPSYCRWRINAPFFSSQSMELPKPLLPRSQRDYRQVVTLAPCRERRPPRTGRQPAVLRQRGLLQERQCVRPSTLPKWTQLMRSS